MYDSCEHCSVRGDITACRQTPCATHSSWFAKTLLTFTHTGFTAVDGDTNFAEQGDSSHVHELGECQTAPANIGGIKVVSAANQAVAGV